MWKIKGKGSPILEVWEDFQGNLWFVAEHIDEDIKFGYARLRNYPEGAEWGTFSIVEIMEAVGGHMVWRVEEKNWSNIETYEKGLLVEV